MNDLYHVAVVGSRPEKAGNRNAPFPMENASFIQSVLMRVPSANYASISHAATDYGVDNAAESFAMETGVRQRQFPSYWFDPTKEKNLNKAAGIQSREAMIRAISDATHNKEHNFGMLLVFHTQENPTEDQGLKTLLEFVTKYHPKIQVRTFRLPVTETVKPQSEQQVIDLNSGTVMPDPFALHQS